MMEPDEETAERNGNGNLNRRFLFKLVRFSGLGWVLRVMVAPCASIRGDEGTPIKVGDNSNVQDGCVIHALETSEGGQEVSNNLFEANGGKYAVYIGKNVSMAHQSQVHGPAVVGNNVFGVMQAFAIKSIIKRVM